MNNVRYTSNLNSDNQSKLWLLSLCAFSISFFSISLFGYSSSIPEKKNADILRVVTYTTRGDQSENAQKESIAAIKHIDPDILVLQEIMVTKIEMRALLSLLGYTHFAIISSSSKNSFADSQVKKYYVICSKIPVKEALLSKKFIASYKHMPALAKVEVDLSSYDKKNLVIYGALFDVLNQKKRLLEVKDLVKLLQKESNLDENGQKKQEQDGQEKNNDHRKNILLAAGFHEERGSVINYLGAHGFINSFDIAGTTIPRPLLSSLQKIDDGIYVQRDSWNLFCDGSYLFSSQHNNHLAVIIDFDLAK